LQHRAQITALQDARSRYQRSGEERETSFVTFRHQLLEKEVSSPEQRIKLAESLRAATAGRVVRVSYPA